MVAEDSGPTKPGWRDVQVMLTPLRIVVREYKMRIIPWRTVASFVSRPSLRVHLDPNDSTRLIIDDGDAAPCVLRFGGGDSCTSSRNVFFGVYSRFLRDRMAGGGKATTFESKRQRLFTHLRNHMSGASEARQNMVINRGVFRESALSQLHGWNNRQWYGKSHVTFRGEEGVDCGGLSDEFWDLLGTNLFTPLAVEAGARGSSEGMAMTGMVEVEVEDADGSLQFVGFRMDLDDAGQLRMMRSGPSVSSMSGAVGGSGSSLADQVALERIALQREGNVASPRVGDAAAGEDMLCSVISVLELGGKRMSLRPPKQGRPGRPFCIRMDLAEPDSIGRRKYVVDPLSNTDQEKWLAALRRWSSAGDVKRCDLFAWRGSEALPLAHPICAAGDASAYTPALLHLCGQYLAKCVLDTSVGRPRQAPVSCTLAFFKLLLGESLQVSDYEAFDPQAFQSRVSYILETPGIEDSGLDLFFVAGSDDGSTLDPLVPGGEDIAVTDANKERYVSLWCRHEMGGSVRGPMAHIREGFSSLCPDEVIGVFTAPELQLLCCGVDTVDWRELRKATQYANDPFGVLARSEGAQWFWQTVEDMTQSELGLLLQFITGAGRLPLGGASQLSPAFTIVASSGADDSLPSAHTCFNRLVLPGYSSFSKLHWALGLAIAEGSQGFSFS